LSAFGIAVDLAKVEAVVKWESPKSTIKIWRHYLYGAQFRVFNDT